MNINFSMALWWREDCLISAIASLLRFDPLAASVTCFMDTTHSRIQGYCILNRGGRILSELQGQNLLTRGKDCMW